MNNWQKSGCLVAALLFCVLGLADTSLATKLGPIDFGGAIELETGWRRGFDRVSESFFKLATAEFDFDVQVNEWARGTLQVGWDSGADKFMVDEAFVTIGNLEKFPLFLRGGRVVIPFGISTGAKLGDTLSLTGPLTTSAFEAKEEAVLLGVEMEGLRASVYAFNGSTNQNGGENHLEHFGGTVSYHQQIGNVSFDIGVDVISSVFDTDGLTDLLRDLFAQPTGDLVIDYIPGLAAHWRARLGGFALIAEYNGALRVVELTTFAGDTLRIKPRAWMLEGGYTMELLGQETYAALAYSRSYDVVGALPKYRITATVGRWVWEGVRVAVGYAYDKDYTEAAGGTGAAAKTVLVKLTYEW